MELVKIAENAMTVELDWAGCTLLAHIIREALSSDMLHDADNWSATHCYARTLISFLEAGGLASWAYTVEQEKFTLEEFLSWLVGSSALRCRRLRRAVAGVVAQERRPGLPGAPWWVGIAHVLLDGPLGYPDVQLHELAADALRTPQGVRRRHFLDERDRFNWHFGPARR